MPRVPLTYLFIFATVFLWAAPVIGAASSEAAESESVSDPQQKGMEENLEGAIPASDLDEEQRLEDSADAQADDNSDSAAVKKSEEELEQLENELQLESADRGTVLLDSTDRVMEFSRLPLTYIQENVPFLTKRNIIFFGRLEIDGARYSSGVLEDDNGFTIRRFRLGLAGRVRFWPGWNYKLEFDLTDGENSLSDAYLSWRSEKWGTFRFGNQKVAQTLSGQTSSLSNTFMERPLPVLAFTLQRRLGLGWDTHHNRLGANITVFAGDPNEGVGSQGWAARGYFNPARGKGHAFHVGGSFMQFSSDRDARMWARPESHVTGIRLVDTGIWSDVDTSSAVGLEVAGSRGPVTIKSEFYNTEWTRSDGGNPRFKGWYAEASWFLTGEMAHYRDGKFLRPNIEGDRGAWEVAFRFSTIDLIDEDVQGGTQKNLSFGVNWYSKTHWRFMGNVIKVKAKDGPYGKQEPWIAQFRVQYYF
jgi:phosphate-selective porin OprO/OprP